MVKRTLFLLGIGSFVLSIVAQANVFEIPEYSELEKYLKPEQQKAFEKVIGGNLNMIKNKGYILEKLEKDIEKNAETIGDVQKEIENLKLENDREIVKLKRDFARNPQRYNPENIYSYSEETK